jgi:hypothetical protein
MGKEWLQLALKMAENARAGLAKERKQSETVSAEKVKAIDEQPLAASSR